MVVQLHGGRAAVGTVIGPPLDADFLQALDLHGEGLLDHRPLRQLHGAGLGNGQSNVPPGLPEVELMAHEKIKENDQRHIHCDAEGADAFQVKTWLLFV